MCKPARAFLFPRKNAMDQTEPRSIAIALTRPFINKPALDAAGLRRGQWVVCADGIGILTACGDVVIEEAVYSDDEQEDGTVDLIKPEVIGLRATVTLVKPDGTTLVELLHDKAVPALRIVEIETLRAAYIEEIPDTRHEGADHLRSFGYISASEA
jgi:hypothetical protein